GAVPAANIRAAVVGALGPVPDQQGDHAETNNPRNTLRRRGDAPIASKPGVASPCRVLSLTLDGSPASDRGWRPADVSLLGCAVADVPRRPVVSPVRVRAIRARGIAGLWRRLSCGVSTCGHDEK